jgi:hypothetical protein
MSGWLGTINYGVIIADKVDRFLREKLGCAAPSVSEAVDS